MAICTVIVRHGAEEGNPLGRAVPQGIRTNLPGCSIGFLTLVEMWTTLLAELRRTPAASEIGRLAQLLKAAGLTAEYAVAAPSDPSPGSDAAAVAAQEEEEAAS